MFLAVNAELLIASQMQFCYIMLWTQKQDLQQLNAVEKKRDGDVFDLKSWPGVTVQQGSQTGEQTGGTLIEAGEDMNLERRQTQD